MSDVLKPSITLLVKLGSLAVHVEEYHSPYGHPVDKEAIDAILNDAEVKEWMGLMGSMAFLPVKRNK